MEHIATASLCIYSIRLLSALQIPSGPLESACRWGDHVELGKFQLAESWANAQFQKDRDSTRFKGCLPEHSASENCSFQFLEGTWWEQRKFCTDVAADTLSAADHPLWIDHLKPELQATTAAVVAPDPTKDGFSPLVPAAGQPIKVGDLVSLAFDATTGALSQLDVNGTSWASAANSLLEIEYQTYNISQFQAFQRAYSNLTNPPDYFPHDFGKPNDTAAVAHVQTAVARRFWMKHPLRESQNQTAAGFMRRPSQRQWQDEDKTTTGATSSSSSSTASFLIELAFSDPNLSQEYGAPTSIWTRLDIILPDHASMSRGSGTGSAVSIEVTVDLIGKVATRHAEATFVRFVPANV